MLHRMFPILAAAVLWSVTQASAEVYSDKIAAVVNGDVILHSEVIKYKHPFVRSFFQGFDLGVVPPGKWPTEKEILDELVVIRLIEQEAKHKGAKIGDQQVLAHAEMIKKRNRMSQDQFVEQLAANGLTFDGYKKLIKRVITLNLMWSSEVAQKIPVREEEAQQFYKDHKDEIPAKWRDLKEKMIPARPPTAQEEEPKIPTSYEVRTGGSVKLRQITIKEPAVKNRAAMEAFEKKVRTVMEEHQKGADFGALARKYSQDSMAAKGGEIGWMAYKEMNPQLQKVVERLKKGALHPVKTAQGAMLLYVEDEKSRQLKTIPYSEQERKEMEDQLKAHRKALEQRASAQRSEAAERGDSKSDEAGDEEDAKFLGGNKDPKPLKPLGILSEDEEKAYGKVRNKVMAILRMERSQKRLKEWLEELKKRAIIDVKL
ncbi:MAG: peptidylprolyl isomerase [Thermodesulfobacteriota bacterium]